MNKLIFKLKSIYSQIENKKILIPALLVFDIVFGISKIDIKDINFFQFSTYIIQNLYYSFVIFCVLISIAFSIDIRNSKSHSTIISCKTKKGYIEHVMNQFIYSAGVLLIANIIFFMIWAFINFEGKYEITNIAFYNVSFLTYFFFYYIRLSIIFLLYGLMVILISNILGRKAGVILSIILGASLFAPIESFVISDISQMRWYTSYFLFLMEFPTFMTEVFCSTLYILVLLIIVYGLYYIYKKYSKDIL